jgi:hypothetical protein
MNIADTIKRNLATISSMMDNPTVIWHNEEFACVAGSAGNAFILTEGGQMKQADLVLVINRDLFTDGVIPQSKQTVIYKDQTYRIGKVTTDPMSATVKLTCESATKGI